MVLGIARESDRALVVGGNDCGKLEQMQAYFLSPPTNYHFSFPPYVPRASFLFGSVPQRRGKMGDARQSLCLSSQERS